MATSSPGTPLAARSADDNPARREDVDPFPTSDRDATRLGLDAGGDYLNRAGARTKIVFVNDGPGLLLGAMWRKYGELEAKWPKKILVATLKMLGTRLSVEWLRS